MMMPGASDNPNEAISRRLKALYSSIEQEEIPDRFLDLLEKLDAAEEAARSVKEG
ncbi:NepR family anti-sigma factor [Martelella sp. HB161492]|uniref:NepR family anti-sigma factor n=1 Tax=Martelella sp. HB161492 TaxID=2720726 RepID=UPI001FEFF700|nr:NepR family anti-sigma factor [Martelella sp. HB161492]